MDDPLGADRPRVADVDHVRGLDVQPDLEAREEDRRGDEHPHRPERPRPRGPTFDSHPQRPPEQVGERRVSERDAREDVAAVEVPERRREEEEREQVEVPQAAQTTKVGEPEQEDRTEAEPDPVVVDLRAPEGSGAAAGHSPRDLSAGEGLAHRVSPRRTVA